MAVSSLLVAFLAMQRGQKPCRWSWPTLSCEPHRECKFSWQQFRCVQRTPAAPTKQAASKLQPAAPTPKATPAAADAAPAKPAAPAAQPAAAQQPAAQQPAAPAQQPAAAAAQPAPQQQQPSTPAAQPAQQQPAATATPPGGMPAWVAPLQKGMQLQQGGRWAEAADAYKEACAHEMPLQQAVAARSNLGLAFQNTEQYERALAAYDDALKLAPTYADGHHNRGNALYKLGRFDDAAEAFGTAVKCARAAAPTQTPRLSRASLLPNLSGLFRPTASRTSTAATPSTNWGATTRPPPPSVRC